MFMTAMYGQWKALYFLIFPIAWHIAWMIVFSRDPQYWAIMMRQCVWYPWPEWVQAWPGLGAKPVKIEASVPFRGEAAYSA